MSSTTTGSSEKKKKIIKKADTQHSPPTKEKQQQPQPTPEKEPLEKKRTVPSRTKSSKASLQVSKDNKKRVSKKLTESPVGNAELESAKDEVVKLKQLLKEKEAYIGELLKEIEKLKEQIPPPEPVIEEDESISYELKKGKKLKLHGEWVGANAGGAYDKLSWRYNPQIFIGLSSTCSIEINLSQPAKSTLAPIGWYLFKGQTENPRRLLMANENDIMVKSGFFMEKEVSKSFALKKTKEPYVLLPCTLEPGEESSFTVSLSSDIPITAQLISPEQEWPLAPILGQWVGKSAGGYHKYDTSVNNPQYLLNIEKQTPIKILLLQEKFKEFSNIGLYVISLDPSRKYKLTESGALNNIDTQITEPKFDDPNVSYFSFNAKPGKYVILPCTYEPGAEASFKIMIMGEDISPVRELPEPPCVQINGEWRGETAGGCLNDIRRWRYNTQYLLSAKTDIEISIKVKQIRDGAAELESSGFYLFNASRRMVLPKKKNILLKSKFIKNADGVIEKVRLTTEPIILVPCTLDSDKEGSYSVQIYSDDPSVKDIISIEPLTQDRDRQKVMVMGEWSGNSAGGCLNYPTWINNPQFLLEITKTSEVIIFLTCTSAKQDITPGFYLVHAPSSNHVKLKQKPEDILAKAAFREDTEVHKKIKLEPGIYFIIPCTYHYGQDSKFELSVWASDFGVVQLKPVPEN